MITGGAGFIASHAVILLTKKYPQCRIVNFDKLDYVACLKNLDCVAECPNYKFIKVRRRGLHGVGWRWPFVPVKLMQDPAWFAQVWTLTSPIHSPSPTLLHPAAGTLRYFI
jgi:hypothetical protein